MSIQTELTRLTNAKSAIKAAIEGKGVSVPDSTLLDGMAALIESIQAGGGGAKFSSGTFTPAETTSINLPYKIEHNSGFVPDIFVVIKYYEAQYAQYSIQQALSLPAAFLSVGATGYKGYAFGWGSSSYGSNPSGTAVIQNEFTDKVAYIRSNNANNKVVAGTEYTWIAFGGLQ